MAFLGNLSLFYWLKHSPKTWWIHFSGKVEVNLLFSVNSLTRNNFRNSWLSMYNFNIYLFKSTKIIYFSLWAQYILVEVFFLHQYVKLCDSHGLFWHCHLVKNFSACILMASCFGSKIWPRLSPLVISFSVGRPITPTLVENDIAVSDSPVILLMSGTANSFHESYSSPKLFGIELEYLFSEDCNIAFQGHQITLAHFEEAVKHIVKFMQMWRKEYQTRWVTIIF